jgi:monothiol glutaredoxin
MAETTETQSPEIVAWMKPSCGWSNGVRAVFARYGLAYEDRDIINDADNFYEMVRLTGQQLQPSVRVGETVLADISGDELEQWLLENEIVQRVGNDSEVPLDQGCADHGGGEFVATELSEPSE